MQNESKKLENYLGIARDLKKLYDNQRCVGGEGKRGTIMERLVKSLAELEIYIEDDIIKTKAVLKST